MITQELAAPAISESTRRRPGFRTGSIPIRLADGQEWYFPPRRPIFYPGIEPDYRVALRFALSRGPDIDEAIDQAIEALSVAESNADIVIGIMTIGAILLRENYDLADDELESLFVFGFDTEESMNRSMIMINELHGVI